MQTENKPLILICNDDGYDSNGLSYLIDFVRDLGEVVVVAPSGPRSGASMSITSRTHIECSLVKEESHLHIYKCSGTPVDCIKMGLEVILDRVPDLVLSGINHGDNSSVNTYYSGTMGIVLEACMKRLPAVGFSSCHYSTSSPMDNLREYVRKIVRYVLSEGLPMYTCLNVNFPTNDPIKGVKWCRMGHGEWVNEWEHQIHPRGWEYYWLTGEYESQEPGAAGTDTTGLSEGYVTITPTRLDLTDYSYLERMRDLEF